MRLADRNGGQLHQIGYRGQYPLAALAAAARAALRPLGPTGLALRPVEVDRSTQTHPKVTMGHPNPPQGLCFLCRDLHSSLLVLVYICQFENNGVNDLIKPQDWSQTLNLYSHITYHMCIVTSIHSIKSFYVLDIQPKSLSQSSLHICLIPKFIIRVKDKFCCNVSKTFRVVSMTSTSPK